MKYVFLILLAGVLLTAGCTGGDQNPATAPATVAATHPVPAPARTTSPAALPATTTGVPAEPAMETAAPSPSATAAGVPTDSSMQTYTNKEFGFAMQVPASWNASGAWITSATGGKKYKVTFTDANDENLQYVSISPGATGMNLNDYYNIYLKQFQSDPTVTVTSQDSLQLGGTPAKRIICTTKWSGGDLESTIVMAIRGDNAYFMEFTSKKDEFPAYSQQSDAIIRSFTFT